MMSIPGLASVLLPFAATWFEFIFKRPKRFFEDRDRMPDRYLNASAFACVNIFLTACALVLPSLYRDGTVDRWDVVAGSITAAATLFVQYCATLGGSFAAARFLREHVTAPDVSLAFCYASAVLRLVTLVTAPVMDAFFFEAHPEPWVLLLVFTAEIVFFAYIIAAVARANVLSGRRFVRFVTMAGILVVLLRGLLGIPLMRVLENVERRRVSEAAALPSYPPKPCEQPTVITGPVRNVTPYSAELTGSATDATQTWFEFDTTSAFAFWIDAQRHTAVAGYLKPRTTYFYRYVAENACGTVRGETRMFQTTTSPP